MWVKQRKVTHHSYIMFTVYIIHTLSVLLFMWTPAINILSNPQPASLGIITTVHGAVGVIVLALSTYVILRWRLRGSVASCYKMRKEMRALTVLWVAEAVLGALVY